jgi:hypothetical protein
MKNQFKAMLALCIIVTGSVARSETTPVSTNTAASATNAAVPKIQFADLLYDFGRVASGTLVKHDFIFTNVGNATLEVTAVNPGCGCTTIGEWTHKVEPGKTGVIPIQFNSSGYNATVTKIPSISCNDPGEPNVTLQLHGTVFNPVVITPPFLSLTPDSAGNATGTVHIVSNEDEPLTLSKPTSLLRTFTAELTTNTPGKDFTLTIKTVPPLDASTTQGLISMHSSSTNVPDVNVLASVVMPAPAVPAPTNVSIRVTPPAK